MVQILYIVTDECLIIVTIDVILLLANYTLWGMCMCVCTCIRIYAYSIDGEIIMCVILFFKEAKYFLICQLQDKTQNKTKSGIS